MQLVYIGWTFKRVDGSVNASSPWLNRFWAYLAERFPPVNAVMFLVFYVTCTLVTNTGSNSGPWGVGLRDGLGSLAVIAFFFHLRVFDEHKDYQNDLVYHPQRVLQSGLVSLRDLRIAGALAILTEAIFSAVLSADAFLLWCVCFAYSLLMLMEFFVSKWLHRHFLLYAVSHMMVMPMMVFWIAAMNQRLDDLPASWVWMACLSFFSGMAFEISRKIKSPEDERDGVMTYSKLLSPRGAAVSAWMCLMVSAGLLALLVGEASNRGLRIWIAVLVLLCSFLFARFVIHLRQAKWLEWTSSLFMLSAYGTLVAVMVHTHGIRWTSF